VFNQPDYYKHVMDTVPEPMSEVESICSSAVSLPPGTSPPHTCRDVQDSEALLFQIWGPTSWLQTRDRSF